MACCKSPRLETTETECTNGDTIITTTCRSCSDVQHKIISRKDKK